ncbi:hypothetical protein [Rhabdochromatium marinum]|uniref:hypothetical protein n=1 Tax=Rhabdochromatium marinum TaxID=48729 RepID=UPI001902E8CB|nr:hypothetical protein [Rhabdochromatium marinum]MBK1649039.1 hypothetical protein [Rhabdochromatium marinum]
MSDALQEATKLAADVYTAFMRDVVESHVLADRTGGELDNKKAAARDAGRIIDTRVVRLMSISGKGGYSGDAKLRERYAASTNVTLLDHLLSVVRGALTFATLEVLGANPNADRAALLSQLQILAAIAFVHDLDKDLQLPRDTPLPLDQVAERWARYGLNQFVGGDHVLTPDQVRYLIEQAETTQAHRSPPAVYPPRQIEQLTRYIALADKLDGLWLSDGVDAVLKRLSTDRSLSTNVLRDWAVIDIFDPHHPFLLDELQRAIASKSWPVPPLLEVHQDGRLLMLIPADRAEQIKVRAVKATCAYLSRKLFGMRVNISNRGTPEILDAAPDHETLATFMSSDELPARDLGRLFLVKAGLANAETTHHMDALLGDVGLGPMWPKAAGQTLSPYPAPERLSEDAQHLLRKAGHLILLLSHKQVKELPDYAQREQLVIDAVDQERPEWIKAIEDAASRRAMTALWATRQAADDALIDERIWGDDGLLQGWLEGADGRRGLRDTIQGGGQNIIEAVSTHFIERLNGSATCQAEVDTKRCIFTDVPVSDSATFASADQLYEIKKSAFSGRDGRLESIESARGETHISPVAYAEHRFRSFIHASVVAKPDGIPTLLSSPATTGLFAALALNNDQVIGTLSVYDLAREQPAKGLVYEGYEVYQHRYRVARFERIPERTEEQVDQLRLLLRAALRIGRPIHLFRGLPTQEKAFFAFDAMPRRLADLIGGSRLRIEQILGALQRLETAQLILTTNGLGFEVFDRYARAETRLGATCLSWAQLHNEAKDGKPDRGARFRREFEQLVMENNMSKTEAPLVALGRAAARIQQRPRWDASANEELLAFNISLETAIAVWKLGQRDAESLAMAIAGELDTNLVRKQKAAAKNHRDDVNFTTECLAFAERFVDDVWFGVLNGRPPAQVNRKTLASIYRMSFLTAPRPKAEADQETSSTETTD